MKDPAKEGEGEVAVAKGPAKRGGLRGHRDAEAHVRGLSRYVDDEPAPTGLLHGAVFGSPSAHGVLRRLDLSRAVAMPGVVRVLTAADIPGENQIGAVIADEPLLAEGEVHFHGQPVALVLAEDAHRARRAAAEIVAEIEPLPVITDPKEAHRRGELIAEPQTLEAGDVDAAWDQCHRVVSGSCDLGGQEHVYLETQRARAVPEEGGALRVSSSTQSPYAGQKAVARILDLPLHQVEIDVKRLGGGFGGKEDQATPWACLAALGAQVTGRPVEIVLSRADDLRMTGKRHPYRSDFTIGVDAEGRILALDVKHYQNSGAACDLSLAVLGRTLFHSTNSYFIPNVRVWGAPCRTNLPPNTAFRGFGGPQGMFVIESALTKAAEALELPRETLQERNLMRPEHRFPYGQRAETVSVARCWREMDETFDLSAARRRVDAFNAESFAEKKGLAVMPVTFGISFTATFMNQAGALLHVYTDGSLSLSSGGVEMGQGLFTNLAEVAARALGIDPARVRVESTNTRRVANMSPSAASSTTLLNGNAVLRAAEEVRARLLTFLAERESLPVEELSIAEERVLCRGEATDWDWPRLVQEAYFARVDLSAHGFFATPTIHFDTERGKGHPFAYHVCGAALMEVTVDCLRGTYRLDAVRLVHDLGRALVPKVDLGQIEGGLAQGLGWMTLEDLRYAGDGRLLSSALATYKLPDVDFMPDQLDVHFLEEADVDLGPYHSKAVGEPPLMYGIGVFFALRDAIAAFRPDRDLPFDAPMTPERVMMQLAGDHALRPEPTERPEPAKDPQAVGT